MGTTDRFGCTDVLKSVKSSQDIVKIGSYGYKEQLVEIIS
jgi:hypothetical protein